MKSIEFPNVTTTTASKLSMVFLVVALLQNNSNGQSTINVPGDFPTIQAALSAGSSGDTILVGPGVYTQNLDFLGKAIALRSTDGPGSTSISVSGGIGVLIGGPAEISGFTVSGARSDFGAGIRVSGSGTVIQGNIFEGNTQSGGGFGAAIGGNGASPLVIGNVFRNNTSDFQFLSGVVSFVNSSSPLIANNLFYENTSRGINLTLPTGNNPRVVNNTFVGNDVAIRVDRRTNSNSYEFRNNIIAQNGIGLEVDFGGEANNPTWEHNIVFDNTTNYDVINDQTGLNGNLSVDPMFIDATANDYRIAFNSPAIDSGTSGDALLYDFNGTVRPLDGNFDGLIEFDIGAFEVVPEPSTTLLILTWPIALLHRRRRS